MRLRRTTEETADETKGWLSSIKDSADERLKDETASVRAEDESRSWFDRARAKYGLGALMVVAGIGLFVFPEPMTSTVGILMIGVGALVWLVSWLR